MKKIQTFCLKKNSLYGVCGVFYYFRLFSSLLNLDSSTRARFRYRGKTKFIYRCFSFSCASLGPNKLVCGIAREQQEHKQKKIAI
jgi:hypothetical protein